MKKVRMQALQPTLVPSRIAAWAKEISPQVVVDSMDFPTETAKIVEHLGTD